MSDVVWLECACFTESRNMHGEHVWLDSTRLITCQVEPLKSLHWSDLHRRDHHACCSKYGNCGASKHGPGGSGRSLRSAECSSPDDMRAGVSKRHACALSAEERQSSTSLGRYLVDHQQLALQIQIVYRCQRVSCMQMTVGGLRTDQRDHQSTAGFRQWATPSEHRVTQPK